MYQPKLRTLNKTVLKPIVVDNSPSQAVSLPLQSKQTDKAQIAASPSSSSSSMTQFCSYLASGSTNSSLSKHPAKSSIKNLTCLDSQPSSSTSASLSLITSNLSSYNNSSNNQATSVSNYLRASEL